MPAPVPIPINRKLTPWQKWRAIVYLIIVILVSSAVFWHLDDPTNHAFARRHPFPKMLIGVGLLFDLMSCACYISTLITGRFSSGVPGIGLICFFWAWLSCPVAIILGTPQNLPMLWLHKLADLLALFIVSVCFHLPGCFQSRHPK